MIGRHPGSAALWVVSLVVALACFGALPSTASAHGGGPDATNYEGEKILLYLDTQLSAFYAAEALDPHFCEGDHLKPFARFEPTIDGWSAAVQLATLKV